MLGYVIEHFEKYIKETDVHETILDDNLVPENMVGPKAIDDCLKEMLPEAKKSRELEQDQSLEKIRQKILNIMGPLSKLWVGMDEIKCSGKSGRMSLEDLSTAIEQTVVLWAWLPSLSRINVDIMYRPHFYQIFKNRHLS